MLKNKFSAEATINPGQIIDMDGDGYGDLWFIGVTAGHRRQPRAVYS